jgi:hypothetical protein
LSRRLGADTSAQDAQPCFTERFDDLLRTGNSVPRESDHDGNDLRERMPYDDDIVHLEKKYRAEQRLFYTGVHMQRHTIGTRGNATSFPLPWDDLLRLLKDVDNTMEGAGTASVPRGGVELAQWVQVILKAAGTEKWTKNWCIKLQSVGPLWWLSLRS